MKKLNSALLALMILCSARIYAQTTLTLQPNATQGKDAYFKILTPNLNQGTHQDFAGIAWTNGGTPTVARSVIDFDLNQIPQNAQIISAKLSLYHNPTSPNNSGSHSLPGSNNACYLQRVTSQWDEFTVTWNNQPTTTSTNQVTIPASTSTNQSYPNIDVTNLVQDMIDYPSTSFGFMIKLQNESYYKALLFASSDNANPNLHPKLIITYSVSNPLTISASVQNHVSCNGDFDGAASVSVSGGTAPYSYAWSNGGTANNIWGLVAGTYSVTVTDNIGASTMSSVVINEPSPLNLVVGTTPPVCHGEHTGKAFATSKSGGTPPYSVTWFLSVQGDSIDNMPAGSYPVQLFDQNGCYITESITIPEKDSITMSFQSSDVTCQNGSDGEITALPTGSNWGFTYNWSNGATTNSITSLSEGSYSVTVTDALGCTSGATEVLTFVNESPIVDLGTDTAVGPNYVMTLSSEYPNATNLWSTNQTTESIDVPVMSDTTIWVSVSSNGCIGSDTINISVLLSAAIPEKEATIQLYPNPTNDVLNVNIEGVQAEELTVQVLNYNGQLMEEQHYGNIVARYQTELHLGNYSKGVYFINVLIDGNRYTKRISVY